MLMPKDWVNAQAKISGFRSIFRIIFVYIILEIIKKKIRDPITS